MTELNIALRQNIGPGITFPMDTGAAAIISLPGGTILTEKVKHSTIKYARMSCVHTCEKIVGYMIPKISAYIFGQIIHLINLIV